MTVVMEQHSFILIKVSHNSVFPLTLAQCDKHTIEHCNQGCMHVEHQL